MVGSAVRAARRRAGVSQAELAERAGTSQPSIARLEKGQVSPTVITLDRIARALGTDLVIDFEPQAWDSRPEHRSRASVTSGRSLGRGVGASRSASVTDTDGAGERREAGVTPCTTVARMRKIVAGLLGAAHGPRRRHPAARRAPAAKERQDATTAGTGSLQGKTAGTDPHGCRGRGQEGRLRPLRAERGRRHVVADDQR